jgi:hypothetical protein
MISPSEFSGSIDQLSDFHGALTDLRTLSMADRRRRRLQSLVLALVFAVEAE